MDKQNLTFTVSIEDASFAKKAKEEVKILESVAEANRQVAAAAKGIAAATNNMATSFVLLQREPSNSPTILKAQQSRLPHSGKA